VSSQLNSKHVINKIKMHVEREEKGISKKNSARLLLKLLTDNPNQLHLFHPLGEKDRDCISSKIQEFKPIPKSQFVFPRYGVDHEKLQKNIEYIAAKVTSFIKIKEMLRLIPDNESALEENEKTIKLSFENKNMDLPLT